MTDFTIAALDGVLPSALSVTLDILAAANQVAAGLGVRPVRWRVVGSSGSVALGHGLTLAAVALSERTRLGDSVLVVPGLRLLPPGDGQGEVPAYLARRILRPDADALAALMAAHHRRGGVVAASCSSVLIAGRAGLLDGRRATTHWRLAELLRRSHPGCRLEMTRMVVEDRGLVSAGAAMAQMDLMLRLVQQRMGPRVMDAVMRYLLLDSRPTQALHAAWHTLASRDELVARIEALVEEALPALPGVDDIAARLHLSVRTLARRVQRATGQTPKALMQAIRLRRARHLMETTPLALAEVAERVGYSDASGLYRLTRSLAQSAPGRLRPRA